MTRIKPDLSRVPSIKTAEDAENALRQIGEYQRAIDAAENTLKNDIDALKSAFKHDTAQAAADLKMWSDALGRYATENRGLLFKSAKTIKTIFGAFGFRQSTALKMDKGYTKDQLVGLLQDAGMDEYIRVKYEPDVEKLRTCTPKPLALVHAKVESRDTFFVEIPEIEQ